MATNDFLVFGGGAGANVITQAAWAALAARTAGFSSGVAQSAQLNKAWRQSSIMAALLGQFIGDKSGQNAIDDGTIATLETNLIAAIKACATELFTGSNQSFGVSGYQKLPGGLILQWGYITGFSRYTITLPTAFPIGPLGQPIACCLGQTTAAPGAAAFAETSPVVSNQFNIFTYIPASGGGSVNGARAVAWACLGR